MLLAKLCLFFLLVALSLVKGSTDSTILRRDSRAATINPDALWPNGSIYYLIDSSVTGLLGENIRHAMDVWENATCLRFVPGSNVGDHVRFLNRPNEEYCTCDSIGKKIGQQNITIGYSCRSVGDLLHAIGHIIGLYHEHARPDRDDYVKILRENIEEGEERHFANVTDQMLSYQGVGYDYASVMHLRNNSYSSNGYPTLEVTNKEAHTAQGEPELGRMQSLSTGDALRVNRLYSCPGVGWCERLLVTVRGFEKLAKEHGMQHRVEVTVMGTCMRYQLVIIFVKNMVSVIQYGMKHWNFQSAEPSGSSSTSEL